MNNILKKKNNIIFLAFISIMIVLSLSIVINEEYSINDSGTNHNIELTKVSAGSAVVTVKDAAERKSGSSISSTKYKENGNALKGANVKVYKGNNLVKESSTNSSGKTKIELENGNYTFKISYSTYKTHVKNYEIKGENIPISHLFQPDIGFIVNYGGNSQKIDKLMSMSKRIYYINSDPDYESDKEWLLEESSFVFLFMYGPSYKFDANKILNNTKANNNFKVAYCFGTYDDFLKDLKINFLGATKNKNTPHTFENTVVGSYFKADYGENLDTSILNENMKNLLSYIFYLLGETSTNPLNDVNKAPKMDPSWGIYHSGRTWDFRPSQNDIIKWMKVNPGYTSTGNLKWMDKEYASWSKTRGMSILVKEFEAWYKKNRKLKSSFVVIASYYPGGKLIDKLISTYEKNGRAAFNVFQSNTNPSLSSILVSIAKHLNRKIVAINSLTSWSMNYDNMGKGGAISDFKKLNVQVIKGIFDISEKSYKSQFGPQIEWTEQVTIPSFEGQNGAILLSYLDSNGKVKLVNAGILKMVQSTMKWAKLKEKSNRNKKIAVVLYNYPPGKAEIGASYLDVFKSLRQLLIKLHRSGYNIGSKKSIPSVKKLYTMMSLAGNKGTWAKKYLNSYVKKNLKSLKKNRQLVTLSQFQKLFSTFPNKLKKQLIRKWGHGLGEIMVYKNSRIVIPGYRFGNVFVTIQPSRGWEEVTNYHDTTLPPHQQYVTFYKWMNKVFKADAMIHLGTHGTMEFLPGRSIGLQEDDWTFQLSGIPNVYPYIVSNPGEALVAKERAEALLISHMTPAMIKSEAYGTYVEINDLITRYESAVKVKSPTAKSLQKQILKLAKKAAIPLPKKGQKFSKWLDEVHYLIEDLENDVISYGLHSIGKVLKGKELLAGVITIVTSKTEIYNYITKLLYPKSKYKYYTILNSGKYPKQVKRIQLFLKKFVSGLIRKKIKNIDAFAKKYKISKGRYKNGTFEYSNFYSALLLCNQTINDIRGNTEWKSIMNALSGGYVEPGLASDPAYGDSIPTGKNIYSLDTTKLPSKAAWDTAQGIVDALLVDYYKTYKKFPETVALIIWGTELLRTEGIGMAEFLYFLGVKPVWDKTGTVKGVSLIPLKDLKVKIGNKYKLRPRIDVYASAVTSNINWLKLMNDAVALANNAPNEKHSQNYVKKHYEGFPSLDRIFGLPGAVLEGTGMSDYIPKTAEWDDSINLSAELTEIYLSRVSNSWNVDSNGKLVVKSNRPVYEYLLKNTDLVTQNLDSSWRLLDSDDYYDWFGGLLGASQHLGAKPHTAIVDIRNKNNIVTRTLEEQIDFEIRSTVMNPLYKRGLFKSGPSGWLAYAEKFKNIFGFNMVANGKNGKSLISDSMMDSLAKDVLQTSKLINSDYAAYSMQSVIAYMLTMAKTGKWKADKKVLNELANKYVEIANKYGLACCHHTCANLDFNNFVIKVASQPQSSQKQATDPGMASQSGSQASNAGEKGESQKSPSTKAYDVTTDQSNTNNGESSISPVFIGFVLLVIALFIVGYAKRKEL